KQAFSFDESSDLKKHDDLLFLFLIVLYHEHIFYTVTLILLVKPMQLVLVLNFDLIHRTFELDVLNDDNILFLLGIDMSNNKQEKTPLKTNYISLILYHGNPLTKTHQLSSRIVYIVIQLIMHVLVKRVSLSYLLYQVTCNL